MLTDTSEPTSAPPAPTTTAVGGRVTPEGGAEPRPRLSICIPTYNRSEALTRLLSSIENALPKLSTPQRDQIEVLISDNASTDNTAEVIREFRARLPKLAAWANPQNLGAEGNFLVLLTRARGEFLWVIGDDDRLRPGALKFVLQQLKPGLGMLLLNFSLYDFRQGVLLCGNGRGQTEDEDDLDAETLLRRHSAAASYISVVVFHRKLFELLDVGIYERLASCGHAVLYITSSGLLKTGLRAATRAEPVIDGNRSYSGEYDWHRVFVNGATRVFAELRREGYSYRANRLARQRQMCATVPGRLALEALDHRMKRWKMLRACVICYWDLPRLWTLVVPVLLLPAPVIRQMYHWKHREKRALGLG